jgi:hypothetical protein
MTCEKFSESIGAMVEGTIGPDARRALDEHVVACESCRLLVADLRLIRDEAALLPKVAPPEALWTKVRSRLETELSESEPSRARRRSPAGWLPSLSAWLPSRSGWLRPLSAWARGLAAWIRPLVSTPLRAAAFSAAIVAVLAVATTIALFGPRLTPGGRSPAAVATSAAGAPAGAARASGAAAGAGNAGGAELVQTVAMELRIAEEHYEKAITGLEQIAKAEQASLDPQVAAVLQKNLGIIDQAIRESRVALQSQPTSEMAQESLFEAFRRKVALLQDTIALINEMRKGDQAGAAKIMQNINRSQG